MLIDIIDLPAFPGWLKGFKIVVQNISSFILLHLIGLIKKDQNQRFYKKKVPLGLAASQLLQFLHSTFVDIDPGLGEGSRKSLYPT